MAKGFYLSTSLSKENVRYIYDAILELPFHVDQFNEPVDSFLGFYYSEYIKIWRTKHFWLLERASGAYGVWDADGKSPDWIIYEFILDGQGVMSDWGIMRLSDLVNCDRVLAFWWIYWSQDFAGVVFLQRSLIKWLRTKCAHRIQWRGTTHARSCSFLYDLPSSICV